jgi:hypothetical protein
MVDITKEVYFMDLKLKIIDISIRLVNMLAHEFDEEFANIIGEAICNGDIGMLLDLEEALLEE